MRAALKPFRPCCVCATGHRGHVVNGLPRDASDAAEAIIPSRKGLFRSLRHSRHSMRRSGLARYAIAEPNRMAG